MKAQTDAPRLAAWESTRACPLACVHCRAEAQASPHPDQLTGKEVRALIDDLAEMAGKAQRRPGEPPLIFIVTGGDPLMRADIFDLVSYAHDKGLWVVMSPSGTAVDGSIVERMKSSGVRRISLSLDGSSPEVHDTFRKVPGSFDRLINAVRHAREGELPFQINTTVSQWNIADLQKIYALVREIGAATWDVFLLVPTGRGKVELEITPGQYEEVLRYLATIEKEGAIPVKVTCAPHYVRIASEMQVEKAARLSGCMAGKGFAFVSHTGDVFGCGYLPISAGNIRERPFSRIYAESKLFNQLRDSGNLKGKCSACPWRFRCGGCRARAYGVAGDVLEAEPFCLYEPGGVGNV